MMYNTTTTFVTLIVAASFALAACNKNSADPPRAGTANLKGVGKPGKTTIPAGHPPTGKGAPAGAGGMSGIVTEMKNAASYTYLKLKTATGETWAAVPTAQVKVGQRVTIGSPALMKDFKSKTLKRTFKTIFFGRLVKSGGRISKADAQKKVAAAHAGASKKRGKIDVGKIEKAAAGQTVAEVFAKRKGLANKKVKVRGKVTKFNANIMGKNWLHLQDGTGTAADKSFDLTVTTKARAKVGSVVVIEGLLAVDKNFGAGYVYRAIVENATVTVSK